MSRPVQGRVRDATRGAGYRRRWRPRPRFTHETRPPSRQGAVTCSEMGEGPRSDSGASERAPRDEFSDDERESFRALAESIKTISWRFMMKAEPFDGSDVDARKAFVESVKKIFNTNSHASRFAVRFSGDHIISAEMMRIRQQGLDERPLLVGQVRRVTLLHRMPVLGSESRPNIRHPRSLRKA